MSDLISRQAAIALADKLKDDLPDDERIADGVIAHNEGILEYQTELSLLPSAERTGKWSKEHLSKRGFIYCSECGFGKMENEHRHYNYCPNCGARMVD